MLPETMVLCVKYTKVQLDNMLRFFADRMTSVRFSPKGESVREYALLLRTLGKGESACMVYCRDNRDVLGSSNLRDIKEYCARNGITYLTTLDSLDCRYIRNIIATCRSESRLVILSDS